MMKEFENAFILSGGGTRHMIYLGMLSALEGLNRNPDVIIGTCGGAFTATVYNAFPDDHYRKEYLKSPEYYEFVVNVQQTKEKKLSRIGLLSLKKILEKRNAPFIENVFDRYLVEMNQDLSTNFPSLVETKFSQEIPTIIVGSQILFDPEMTGQKREGAKLYQKMLFTDVETAQKIKVQEVIHVSDNFKESAVSEMIKIKTDFSMLNSARISMSDMFYLKPYFANNQYFAGGAIDLIPIELAKQMAEKVIIENKQSYSKVEESFVRAVLGYSGNERLAEIQNYKPDFQIETNNIKADLKGHFVDKKINWKKFEISLSFPKNYQQFREDMEAQWNYGFQQTMKSISKKD